MTLIIVVAVLLIFIISMAFWAVLFGRDGFSDEDLEISISQETSMPTCPRW